MQLTLDFGEPEEREFVFRDVSELTPEEVGGVEKEVEEQVAFLEEAGKVSSETLQMRITI